MHYMRGPCSSQTLAPTKKILDCEFRDWVVAHLFQAHIEQRCPSQVAARRANDLLLRLMGRSGRPLWIEGHDIGTFIGTQYHTDVFFHEDFVKAFGETFWNAIPSSMPFLPATICCRMRQKNSRVGAVIPPRMSSPLLNPAKTGIGAIHPVPNSLILAFAVAVDHHACMWQGKSVLDKKGSGTVVTSPARSNQLLQSTVIFTNGFAKPPTSSCNSCIRTSTWSFKPDKLNELAESKNSQIPSYASGSNFP